MQKQCCAQSAMFVLVMMALQVSARPMPMETTQQGPSKTPANTWWINTEDNAINPPLGPGQSSRLSYPVQDSVSSAHNWSPLPYDQQFLRDEADYASAQRLHQGQSSASFREVHDGSVQRENQEGAKWQNLNWLHDAKRKDKDHSVDLHRAEENSYHFAHASGDVSQMNGHPSSSRSGPALSYHRFAPLDRSTTQPGPWTHQAVSVLPLVTVPPAFVPILRNDESQPLHYQFAPATSLKAQLSHSDLNAAVPSMMQAVESNPRRATDLIRASKFLQHHPDFVEIVKGNSNVNIPVLVARMSPQAPSFKAAVNAYLFGNKLIWTQKGDSKITPEAADVVTRRFVQRLNGRGTTFVTRDLFALDASSPQTHFVVIPHRSQPAGSLLFEPEAGTKNLQFTIWASSVDLSQLQFVGAASLTIDDATEVIRRTRLYSNSHEETVNDRAVPQAPALFHVAPPLRTRPPRPLTGLYATSKHWLSNLPLLEQVTATGPNGESFLSKDLVLSQHRHSELIKETANKVLFANEAVWYDKPGKTLLDDRSASAIGLSRYHKRSHFVYLAKAEILPLLPYHMVLIPYEIPGQRARLFDSDLRGKSHAFTLWAAHDVPGNDFADKLLFVSGGALSMEKTEHVLQHAENLLDRLKASPIHQL